MALIENKGGGKVTFITKDGGEVEAATPWADVTEIGLSAFGETPSEGTDAVNQSGQYPTVRDYIVHHFRGTGLRHLDHSEGRILDSICYTSYIGARLISSDGEISRCRLFNNRDANLWIDGASGSANCQSVNNHCYGSRVSCYNEGSLTYRAVNDTYADAKIGYYGNILGAGASQTAMTNILFQHNTIRDCVFRGSSNHMVNCIVNVQKAVVEHTELVVDTGYGNPLFNIERHNTGEGNAKIGVELHDKCSFWAGMVLLESWYHPVDHPSGAPAECIRVVTHDAKSYCVRIETLFVDQHNIDGSIGLHIPGATQLLKVDSMFYGFHLENSRAILVNDAPHTQACDITARIADPVKPLSGYIRIGSGWTGSVRMIHGDTGEIESLPEGQSSRHQDGVICLLDLDEGSGNPLDSTDSVSGIYLSGGATWGAGESGAGIVLDGIDSFIILPHQAILNPTAITVWIRVKITAASLHDLTTLASKQENSTGRPNWNLMVDTFNNVTAEVTVGTTSYSAHTTSNPVVADGATWNDIAFTFGSNSLQIYVNGVAVGSPNTSMSGDLSQVSEDWTTIGTNGTFPTDRYLTGTVDSFKMFDHALSDPEVAALSA